MTQDQAKMRLRILATEDVTPTTTQIMCSTRVVRTYCQIKKWVETGLNKRSLFLASGGSAGVIRNGEVGLTWISWPLPAMLRLPATHQTRAFYPLLYYCTAGVSLATASGKQEPTSISLKCYNFLLFLGSNLVQGQNFDWTKSINSVPGSVEWAAS